MLLVVEYFITFNQNLLIDDNLFFILLNSISTYLICYIERNFKLSKYNFCIASFHFFSNFCFACMKLLCIHFSLLVLWANGKQCFHNIIIFSILMGKVLFIWVYFLFDLLIVLIYFFVSLPNQEILVSFHYGFQDEPFSFINFNLPVFL